MNEPHQSGDHGHPQSFWLWIMCLTGVDYFSTLGYQPSIAFEATGLLTPFATVILVLVTLFGALPVYMRVAAKSPTGQGSIAMLEKLVSGWWGKILVLVLLGFAATDFVITKTLSAADAAEHLLNNPLWPDMLKGSYAQLVSTAVLLLVLGAMFLRGFKEVIGLAVVIVVIYLALNLIVIGSSLVYLARHPEHFRHWYDCILAGDWEIHSHELPNVGTGFLGMFLVCVILFPKLALGLSGFETGVAVMPLIKGDPDDKPDHPAGRIRSTRKLLFTAAVIMSLFLLGSSLVTSMLIMPLDLKARPITQKDLETQSVEQLRHQGVHLALITAKGIDLERLKDMKIEELAVKGVKLDELKIKGPAANRALAFLAHGEKIRGDVSSAVMNPMFGEMFGTIYDLSTVIILWFAGASAMAGLLNLVPQYLPRYGMAPEWTKALRPLVILFTIINLFVTWQFDADVNAQGAAYATGVLVLMSSACIATLIDSWRLHSGAWYRRLSWPFAFITFVFVYTTLLNVYEKPDGIKIAIWFILAIVASSVASRLLRSKELRFQGLKFVDDHSKFLWDSMMVLEFPVLVPHRPGNRSIKEKEAIIRVEHRIEKRVPIVFLEAQLGDASDFYQTPLMEISEEDGTFILRVTHCASIAHTITAIALELSKGGQPPEIHFGWSDEHVVSATMKFLFLGEGNIPWLVRELILDFEPDPAKQPRVIVG
jgi:hypothetical protein